MRIIAILSLLLLASPVYAELTKEDIRTIFKEENTASEKRIKEYIDLKIETVNARIDALDKSLNARIDAVDQKLSARIDGVEKSLNAKIDGLDKRMDNMWRLMIGLFGLVTATIAISQIIIAYRDRGRREMQTEIQQLRERLEALENTPS